MTVKSYLNCAQPLMVHYALHHHVEMSEITQWDKATCVKGEKFSPLNEKKKGEVNQFFEVLKQRVCVSVSGVIFFVCDVTV